MKSVLNLKKEKLKGIKTLNKVPGIDTVTTKKFGKIYQVKYFYDIGEGMRMFSFSSKSPSFQNLLSMDFYDLSLNPVISFIIKEDSNEDDIYNMISSITRTTKYKEVKGVRESKLISEFNPIGLFNLVPDEFKPIVIGIAALYGIIFVVPMILQLRNIIVKVYNWAQERYISGPGEEAINKALFIGQSKDDPAFAVYDNLQKYIQFIVDKKANALIICGPPGMSKTYTVRRTLHFADKKPMRDYSIEKGATLGLLATYSLLYKNRKRLLILDDFDTPLTNNDIVNLLKSVTDTYSKRILSLPREKVLGTLDKGEQTIGVPEKFEFDGQIIIITNLRQNQIDKALLSRAPAFEVNYNTEEILQSTKNMLKYINPSIDMNLKEEAYNYILKLYRSDKHITVTFRSVKSSIDARVGNPMGWREMIKVIVGYTGNSILERYLHDLNS